MKRDCTRCRRPFTAADLAREESRNMEAERNDLELGIPGLGSLILGHSLDAEVVGLKAFPPDERPTNVPLIFFAFRVMVGLGLLMAALGIVAFVQRLRGRLYATPWLLRFALAMGPSGLLAVTAGWIAAMNSSFGNSSSALLSRQSLSKSANGLLSMSSTHGALVRRSKASGSKSSPSIHRACW